MNPIIFLLFAVLFFPLAAQSATDNLSVTYYWPFDYNGTCSGFILNKFTGQPYNACRKYVVGPQSSCANYVNCLYKAPTYEAYQDCLEQNFVVYTMQTPVNTTGYNVDVYQYPNCTSPLQPTLFVPFGCLNNQLHDTDGNLCNINWLSTSAVSQLYAFLWNLF